MAQSNIMSRNTIITGKVYALNIRSDNKYRAQVLFTVLAKKGPPGQLGYDGIEAIIEESGLNLFAPIQSEKSSSFGALQDQLKDFLKTNKKCYGDNAKIYKDRVYTFLEAATKAYDDGVLTGPEGRKRISSLGKKRPGKNLSLPNVSTLEKQTADLRNNLEKGGDLSLLASLSSATKQLACVTPPVTHAEEVFTIHDDEAGEGDIQQGLDQTNLDEDAVSDVPKEQDPDPSLNEFDTEFNKLMATSSGVPNLQGGEVEKLFNRMKTKIKSLESTKVSLMRDVDIEKKKNREFRAAAASEIVSGLAPELKKYLSSGEKAKENLSKISESLNKMTLKEETSATTLKELSETIDRMNRVQEAGLDKILGAMAGAGLVTLSEEEDSKEYDVPEALAYITSLLEFSGHTVGADAVHVGDTLKTMSELLTSVVSTLEGMQATIKSSSPPPSPDDFDLRTPPQPRRPVANMGAFKRPAPSQLAGPTPDPAARGGRFLGMKGSSMRLNSLRKVLGESDFDPKIPPPSPSSNRPKGPHF